MGPADDPTGAGQRALTEAFARLRERSHGLGLRRLSELIRADHDLPDSLSHETVRRILKGAPARWSSVKTLALVLARQAVPAEEVAGEVERVRALWLAARAPVEPEAAEVLNPAVLREATRGLYGRTDPVSLVRRARVHVPVFPNGRFLVAPTPTSGAWMCAFTEVERVRDHRPAAQPPWRGDHVSLRGDELISRVCALPFAVGVLVDPGGAVEDTLPLPFHLLVELNGG